MAIRMEIIADDQGNITINGPLQQPILCLGLLEMAKDLVHKHQAQQREAKVRLPGVQEIAAIRGAGSNGQ